MKILVVASTSREAENMRNALRKYNALGRSFRNQYKVVSTGVGKVNAAMETAAELTDAEARDDQYGLVAVVGWCGASAYFHQGEVVIPNSAQYHDAYVPAGFAPELEQKYELQGSDEVTILTGDTCVTKDFVPVLVKKYGTQILFDMEAAAVCQVASEYGVPVLVLKQISDIPSVNGEGIEPFDTWSKTHSDFSMFVTYLENL